MFSEGNSLDDGVRFEKQEHIARTLMTIPANMKATVSNAPPFKFTMRLKCSGVLFTYFSPGHTSSLKQYTKP